MAFIAPKHEGACARGLRSINAIHPESRVITILYPEGTATIATALRCLTTHASSLVNAISYKTRLLR